MTSRTAWTGGNLNAGLGWTAFFNAADLNSLANGSSVLSSVSGITNGTSLDELFDVSIILAISSSTLVAGASLALWLYPLQSDGSTYGDGAFTAGTQAARTPGKFPKVVIPLPLITTTALVGGNEDPLIMPPGTWLPVLQNNSGFTLSSSGNSGKFRSYNENLNN